MARQEGFSCANCGGEVKNGYCERCGDINKTNDNDHTNKDKTKWVWIISLIGVIITICALIAHIITSASDFDISSNPIDYAIYKNARDGSFSYPTGGQYFNSNSERACYFWTDLNVSNMNNFKSFPYLNSFVSYPYHVQLDASKIPKGVDIKFIPSIGIPDFRTRMYIKITSDADLGDYHIEILARGGDEKIRYLPCDLAIHNINYSQVTMYNPEEEGKWWLDLPGPGADPKPYEFHYMG